LSNARRRDAGLAEFDQTFDAFHTLREGRRALRRAWGAATRAPERAEVAQKAINRLGRQGRSREGHGTEGHRPWRQDERFWDLAMAADAGWDRARADFGFFRPEVWLNDRTRAEAVVTAALPDLSGVAWGKTRRLPMRRESFTFLDQIGGQLAGLGLAPDVSSALLDLEGLRRQPGRVSAVTRGWALARTAQLSESCPGWPGQAGWVWGVLYGVWRARSLVECVNSVARMQQARHRKMRQGLLDLKQVYGNVGRFRTGHREGKTPYGLLGLKLPEVSFGEFLKLTPDKLREQLSAQELAA
jgi:hypothetical protein